MGERTRWGWGSLGYTLLGLGSIGCSTAEVRTEEPLGIAAAALTVTVDGHEWSSSDMGKSGHYPCGDAGHGDWTYAGGAFSVSNAKGRGLANPHWGDPAGCEKDGLFDSASFLSTPITGDFELTVRVTALTGMKNAEVGVMLRENIGTDGTGPAAAIAIKHNSNANGCTATDNELDQFACMSRALVGEAPNQGYVVVNESGPTRNKPPNGSAPGGVWLSLQRIGSDFAVAHARDDNGRPGTWVSNGGGEFKPAQAYLGLFAAVSVFTVPGDPLATTSATFDHLSLRLLGGTRYRTGSLGASLLRGEERKPLAALSNGYISTGMNGFYVAPNGMSYKYAQTNDPGGLEVQAIDAQGNLLRNPTPHGNYGFLEGGIAGACDAQNPTDCSVYVAQYVSESETRIRQFTPFLDEDLGWLAFPTGDEPTRIRGLSAKGSKVFVSDYGRPSVCPDITPPATTDADPDEHQNCVVNDAGCNTSTCGAEGSTCTPVSCSASQYVRVVDRDAPDAPCKFALERPGASAVDNDGNVWVVQMATPYPDIVKPDLGAYLRKYPPAIVCVKPDCTACGRSITTGLDNPTAVAIDADNRLFVAENGPSQNIRIYDHIDTTPALAGTIGEAGGAFAGPNPGLLVDPGHGGDHRFYALLGLGLDASGNLYVASNAPRTAIQKFSKTGSLAWGAAAWSLYGLGREIGAFDVDASGNTDYYTLLRRLTLDPDSSEQDFNWKPKSIIRPPYALSSSLPAVAAPIHHFSQGGAMRLRRIGNKRFLFELNDNSLRIFRFVGEVLKPCGSVRLAGSNTRELWFDTNENGQVDSGETSSETGGSFYPEAAEDGSLFLSSWDLWELVIKSQQSQTGEVPLYEIRRKTLYSDFLPTLATGVPRYHSQGGADTLYIEGSIGSEPNPALDDCPTSDTDCVDDCASRPNECCSEPGSCDHTCNSFASCCLWDPGPNAGPSADRAPNKCRDECSACGARSCPASWGRPVVLRFDGWRAAPTNTVPTKTYQIALPTQLDTPTEADDFQMRFMDPLCGCGDWGYTSFDVAGDMFFVQERHGAIHVHDAATGQEVDRLFPGPGASGLMGWSDIPGSMQAFKRPSSSEYLITTIDSFDRGRNLMYSWKQLGLGATCWDRHQCESGFCVDGTCASAACSDTWTPSAIAPLAWYVAADNTVTTSNGNVSLWSDQSGHGFDVSNDFIYGQPSYNSTGWNGTKPTLHFNGGALLRRASFPGPGAGTEHAFTVLGVVRSATDHNGSIAAWWPDAGGLSAVRCSVVTSGGSSFFNLARDDDNWVQQSFTTSADIGTDAHVVAWRFAAGDNAPGTMKITVDGTLYSETQTTTLANLPLDMLIVGARTNLPTWLFQGDISELVLFDSAISDNDVTNFRCYARQKWGGLP